MIEVANREDFEADRFNIEEQRRKDKEREDNIIIKDKINENLDSFRKEKNISSTFEERSEALEIAFELIKNKIFTEKRIKQKYEDDLNSAEKKKEKAMNKFEKIKERIKNTKSPEYFYDFLDSNATGYYRMYLEEHLKKTGISTTYEEEESMCALAKDMIDQGIITDKKAKTIFCSEKKRLTEWKNENLDKFKEYSKKIKSSKFKEFLEDFSFEKYLIEKEVYVI